MKNSMSAKGGSAFGGNFKKDILLIDTEFSGFDVDKHEILQLSAVLLDKKTLKEKKFFSSYVKPKRWKTRNRASMKVNKITLEMLQGAPELKQVLKKFDRTFGHNVIQAFYVGYNDKRFLLESYRATGIKWKFDYHYFDLWGLFYPYLAAKNRLRSVKNFAGFGIESMLRMLKVKKPVNLHDALVDCRVEAEILRKVMKELI